MISILDSDCFCELEEGVFEVGFFFLFFSLAR